MYINLTVNYIKMSNLLCPWSRALLEKIPVHHVVKKYSTLLCLQERDWIGWSASEVVTHFMYYQCSDLLVTHFTYYLFSVLNVTHFIYYHCYNLLVTHLYTASAVVCLVICGL
jgi:hypothetical protein